jgi:RNA polymerase sigma-70 factor, ECF subfamily
MGEPPTNDEAELHRLCDSEQWEVATALVIKRYGREIYELLAALHHDETEAGDVFSLFAEGIWRGLRRFERQSSFRTWAYAVARRCSLRHRRDGGRRAARQAPLPEGSDASILAERVRTETRSYLRTEKRSRIAELRATLPEEDQALLMLRVDRRLSWNDLARVLNDLSSDDEELAEESLRREAARLRKRFQLVKERLYELARREGLVDEGGGAG